MYKKALYETSLDLDNCFDQHTVSWTGLKQPHWWMNTSGVESSNSVVKLFHFYRFLMRGTRSQKVPPTEILLPQVVCRVQSLDWYCDASMSSEWYKSHSPSRTALSFILYSTLQTFIPSLVGVQGPPALNITPRGQSAKAVWEDMLWNIIWPLIADMLLLNWNRKIQWLKNRHLDINDHA